MNDSEGTECSYSQSSHLSPGELLSSRNDRSASDSCTTNSLPAYAGQAIVQENRGYQKRKKEMTPAAINFMHVLQNLSCMFVTTVTVLSVDLILHALYHCSFDDAHMKNCLICRVYAAHQARLCSYSLAVASFPGVFIKSYNYL